METNIFKRLYKRIWSMRVTDFPPAALSGLLHGYLSVYSIVRVNPWLEDEYNTLGEIYDRIREIGRVLSNLVKDSSIHVEERVGHVADLMDCYLVYSDMKYVNTALDVAYEILSLENNGKGACRTPEMCRMLCSCYYFTNEEECMVLAGEILRERRVNENDGKVKNESVEAEWKWCLAEDFYENTIDGECCNRRESFSKGKELEKVDVGLLDPNKLTLHFAVLSVKETK